MENIIINTKVGEQNIKNIVITNNTFKVVNYIVETDLDQISGIKSFEIQPFASYTYNMAVRPLVGGIYTGQITFLDRDDKNKYIWYTICINCERSVVKDNINI